jgi:hypothetical protein
VASVTAESDGACAGREVVIADGVEHGDRRLLVHHRPDDRKLIGLGWPRPWNALRGRPGVDAGTCVTASTPRAVLLASSLWHPLVGCKRRNAALTSDAANVPGSSA